LKKQVIVTVVVTGHPSRVARMENAPRRNADIFPDDYNRAVGVRQIFPEVRKLVGSLAELLRA